ncbi:ubiquinone biosynthesis hydroxylase [Aureimonas jatrophae]|uniref:2-octaprenyl-6-methoxyphenol hydroxylase /2-octaprenyl-3-methyl-6-methoxy-1,4-benzoquinol hydroxylase n=1 Tax=Aureimonas jatrophae TaxID=1166073 RepID=A0A1H0JYJ5_9HYPH|nr:ubiquinone biosynthesis hydroxylase [Aureimonas jatrophae]MBB3950865.1 2-octaprenyl-6-methoxyphenol hydroxylase [Aureimonas jatrophae]SDO48805.1 2-octaprenyl-6-methoxyphenol hydroxylase /2-octaprenyl-3-methyl-6-methoxy-1,4-benzoquinol hydroxylase [Aureimonas jatrophae]
MAEDTSRNLERFDVVVAGAGYVGLSVAVSIKASAPALRVLVVDAAPAEVWRRDGRASAVAAAAVRMLERLGVWHAIQGEAEPIRDMIVTDSRAGDVVRPTLLTFGGEAGPGEPFAHMVPNTALNGALRARAAELGLEIRAGHAVDGIEEGPAFTTVRFAEGASIETRLLVAADGVHSTIRRLSGIRTVHQDYGQKGIVCTVRHERPHNGRAEEHFLPAGPFAILPLKNNRSSLVWTESAAEADRLVRADEMVFELELERRFGLKLGAITVEDRPRAFPLGLTLARDFVRPRLALAGDAAHGIHPIAGQGLNLGFKDAAALAETVVDAARLGRDIGALDTLERYQRWRRFDTLRMGLTTDVLNRLFSNDNGALRAVRSFGLSVVDRLPFAKNGFVRQASGLTGGAVPRLLQGEAI